MPVAAVYSPKSSNFINTKSIYKCWNNQTPLQRWLSLCPTRNGTETITGDRNIVAGAISPLAP
jgi:hypothetical protein